MLKINYYKCLNMDCHGRAAQSRLPKQSQVIGIQLGTEVMLIYIDPCTLGPAAQSPASLVIAPRRKAQVEDPIQLLYIGSSYIQDPLIYRIIYLLYIGWLLYLGYLYSFCTTFRPSRPDETMTNATYSTSSQRPGGQTCIRLSPAERKVGETTSELVCTASSRLQPPGKPRLGVVMHHLQHHVIHHLAVEAQPLYLLVPRHCQYRPLVPVNVPQRPRYLVDARS